MCIEGPWPPQPSEPTLSELEVEKIARASFARLGHVIKPFVTYGNWDGAIDALCDACDALLKGYADGSVYGIYYDDKPEIDVVVEDGIPMSQGKFHCVGRTSINVDSLFP